MIASIGQLQLGFGKSKYDFEEVLPPPPTDVLEVYVVDAQNMDALIFDSSINKWTNKPSKILTDGGNF